ncbi:MAG TPA: hypothetical protein VIM67_09745, partial [Terriglobus sp.]
PELPAPPIPGTLNPVFGFAAMHRSSYVDGGYYFGMLNVLDTRSIHRKIDEIAEHPGQPLLLPPSFESQCVTDVDASRHLIRYLFMYPYRGRAVHVQNASQVLCTYIQNNYQLAVPAQENTYRLEIWSRK